MNKSLNPQLTKQVIIGTKSQSRRKILKLMNLKFQYRSPNINEKKVKDLNNDKYDALKIAKAKAEYLSKNHPLHALLLVLHPKTHNQTARDRMWVAKIP